MSACTSLRGEFSEHTFPTNGTEDWERFVCMECGAFAEDGVLAKLREAESAVQRAHDLADEWWEQYDRWINVHDGPRAQIFKVHATRLRAALDGSIRGGDDS